MAIYLVGMSGERERAAEALTVCLEGMDGIECWLGTFVVSFDGTPEQFVRAVPGFGGLGSGFVVPIEAVALHGKTNGALREAVTALRLASHRR